MTYYFLDSSALVKRYVPESGTNWVRQITHPTGGHIILIAYVTPVEIISALMRRKREGIIDDRTAHALRLLLDHHVSHEYRVLDLTNQIIQKAEDLLESYPLRAYDSIQLASAWVSNARFAAVGLAPLSFITSDMRLNSFAIAEGLAVDDPSDHA